MTGREAGAGGEALKGEIGETGCAWGVRRHSGHGALGGPDAERLLKQAGMAVWTTLCVLEGSEPLVPPTRPGRAPW